MASTTATSTRRVLSDLNVNAALASKAVSSPMKTSGGKLFGEVMMAKGENTVTVVGLAEGKRAVHEGLEGQSASKRRKISISDARGFLVCHVTPPFCLDSSWFTLCTNGWVLFSIVTKSTILSFHLASFIVREQRNQRVAKYHLHQPRWIRVPLPKPTAIISLNTDPITIC